MQHRVILTSHPTSREKRAKYKMYATAGLAFAPAAVNTFGQLGPDLLRIGYSGGLKNKQWLLDHEAKVAGKYTKLF